MDARAQMTRALTVEGLVMAHVEKSLIEVFREGLFWRALGRSALDNPYSPDSIDYAIWFEGWSLIDEIEDHGVPYGESPFDDGPRRAGARSRTRVS
jgi:hypothetical protein